MLRKHSVRAIVLSLCTLGLVPNWCAMLHREVSLSEVLILVLRHPVPRAALPPGAASSVLA